MADISAIADFLKISVHSLVGSARDKGFSVFPDTRLTAARLVEAFGFSFAAPSSGARPPRSTAFYVLRWAVVFLSIAGLGCVIGYTFLNPVPGWMRPKAGAVLWSTLGWIFWGLFTGIWGHVMMVRALARKLLGSAVSGLIVDSGIKKKRQNGYFAYLVQVSVLYKVLDRVFVGETVGFGKAVRSFQNGPPPEVQNALIQNAPGTILSVFFNDREPSRFALKRQLAAKIIALATGGAITAASGFFFAMAGALIRTF